jgi:hypothetical protein
MPTSGATFTDWEQLGLDSRRPLLVDEDFSWSEPPSRRRRSHVSVAPRERAHRVEPEYAPEPTYASEPAYAREPDYALESAYEPEPSYELEPAYGELPSGRRTIVITGRGAEPYPVPRRRAEADLSFHERAAFNPDRTAMWAVLLGLALLLGCIAH